MSTAPLTIPGIPGSLRWDAPPQDWSLAADGTLSITATPQSDLFISPQGDNVTLNAPRLLFAPAGDYRLSARVTVAFEATYDAGVLLVYADERSWAKLCFEYSPQRQPMIVSVVTRGFSDDANAFVVEGTQVFLRVSRLGRAFAFHASTDGAYWQLIRHFTLDSAAPILAGFEAQAPTGAGCTATFDQIAFVAERLSDLRSGA